MTTSKDVKRMPILSLNRRKLLDFGLKLLLFLIPIIIYALVLITRIPFPIRPLGISARYGFTLVIPIVFLAFWAALRLPGILGRFIGITVVIVVFGLSLVGLWASGQSELSVVSGLLPWTDASNYYRDASRLLDGMGFLEMSTWRPLFPGLLAVILGLSGRNLAATIAILVFLTGLAGYLSAREVQRYHGTTAAAIFLLVIYFYYRKISGTLLSENFGLMLALTGFGMLWRGVGSRDKKFALSGLLFTALALNARPGAFFILPCIMLSLTWYFRRDQKISWKFLVLQIAVVGLAFLINIGIMLLVAETPELPFSNFSYAFYGLAVGGEGYFRTFVDHPELRDVDGIERHIKIFILAFEAIRENPSQVITGVQKLWLLFFTDPLRSVYSYFSGENKFTSGIVQFGLYGLAVLAPLGWFTKKETHFPLLASAVIGLVLSVPFVPPTDARYMRLFAASIPVVALLPAIGISFLVQVGKLKKLDTGFVQYPVSNTLAYYGIGLILLVVLGSPIIRLSAKEPQFREMECPPGLEPAIIRYLPGTSVKIHREDVFFLDWLPNYHHGRYRIFVHNLPDIAVIDEFENIDNPATLLNGLNYEIGTDIFFIAPMSLMPETYGFLAACGKYSRNQGVEKYNFYYPEQIQLIHPF